MHLHPFDSDVDFLGTSVDFAPINSICGARSVAVVQVSDNLRFLWNRAYSTF